MGMMRINFYVPSEVVARFESLASRSGFSRSLLLRGAIEAGEKTVFEKVQARLKKTKRSSSSSSVLEFLSGDEPPAFSAVRRTVPNAGPVADEQLFEVVRAVLAKMPKASADEQREAVLAEFPGGELGSEADGRVEAAIRKCFEEPEDSERNFSLPVD